MRLHVCEEVPSPLRPQPTEVLPFVAEALSGALLDVELTVALLLATAATIDDFGYRSPRSARSEETSSRGVPATTG